jgi:hypothetical protein
MATVLDLGLVQYFNVLYPVIFVWALMFAILQKTKMIGDSKSIDATIAVVVSLMVLLSQTIIDIINFMIPWFVVAIIFVMLLLLIFQIFGARDEDILGYMKGDRAVGWVLIGIAVIIIFAAFGNVLGQELVDRGGPVDPGSVGDGSVDSEDFQQNIYNTLFHPKVLGLLVLFGIAVFTIALLSG